MADEIELKLRIPAGSLAAVNSALAGRAGAPRIGLAASYWDTPDRHLAAARMALRVRREGRRRVQTLKGAGADALTRLEHEVPATGDVPDPALHDGTSAGTRLRAVLAAAPDPLLVRQFETVVMRRTALVRTRLGTVELALDTGRIVAGDRVLPVRELEVELKRGAPQAVLVTARRWIARHGLWIDLRSKAALGHRLALGEAGVPALRAQPLRLEASMTPPQALRAMLRNALDQVLGNAAEIADATGSGEHLHQLRVGLRRLRTALRDFGTGMPGLDPAWSTALGTLFRALGAQRDRDAIGAGIGLAMRAAGGPALEADAAADDDIPARLRGVPFNLLMLDLLAFAHDASPSLGPSTPGPATLGDTATRRLRRLHRRVCAEAPGFAALAPEAQHRVRKRLKRLRYALEFCADLFPKRAVTRYLLELRPAQEALGVLNDLSVAQAMLDARRDEGREVWFGLGWLAGRREATVAAAEAALRRLATARRPWSLRRPARR